jgi:hypothetical protein
MKKALFVGAVCTLAIVFLVLVVRFRIEELKANSATPSTDAPEPAEAARIQPGYLFGRVVTNDGDTYEGRLRWGGDQEASWGDYFNGTKADNPWLASVPPGKLPTRPNSIRVFGLVLVHREVPIDTDRRFMARFGDIARIDAKERDVRVTMKSGTAFNLDRMDASDFDDGVRVWDSTRGVLDLDSAQVKSVELLPATGPIAAAGRLHGTVHTARRDFTGFVQWDREECVGTDKLDGSTDGRKLSVRFDTIRSIARQTRNSSLLTLVDGRELVLSGTNDVGNGNRGVYVDDPRYGRVLVSWNAFLRLDLSPAGSGPAYGDFPPGRPLTGSVTTRDGRQLTGRLVYDLDESETTETLDAPSEGVDYTIPFGMIASIVLPDRVTLHNGETLQLERSADLGERNAGILIFVDGGEHPEYVPWTEVVRIVFDHPLA